MMINWERKKEEKEDEEIGKGNSRKKLIMREGRTYKEREDEERRKEREDEERGKEWERKEKEEKYDEELRKKEGKSKEME